MTNQQTLTKPKPTTSVRPSTPTITPNPTTTPAANRGRLRNGKRWMLVGGGAAMVIAGALAVSTFGGDSVELVPPPVADQRPGYQIVQDSIDAALAERAAETRLTQRPGYQIVQDSIDAALAERAAETRLNQRPGYQIVQDSIDAALAERRSSSESSEN